MDKIVKLPVTETLKTMSVGECVTFPIEQSSSVRAVASKLRKDLARTGWDVGISDNKDTFVTTVRRIS